MDFTFKFQSTVRSMQIRMLRLSKENHLFFNKFHLILFCLFVPITKKVVTNYGVFLEVISAFMVKF